jgi:hypothetical protein
MPKRKKKNGITVLTVPQAGKRLNAGEGPRCRMTNGKERFDAGCRRSEKGWEYAEGAHVWGEGRGSLH